MDLTMIIARLVHILGGIFWVGAMVFVTVYLIPSLAEAGPDAGKVMAAITRRGFMRIMPWVAVLVILSGIYLYSRVSGGFDYHYMKSGPGHAFAFGGIFAIIAFMIGISITRPAMTKSGELSQAAMSATGADRDRMMAEAQALRVRAGKVGRIVMWLLIVSAITMAVGRYV